MDAESTANDEQRIHGPGGGRTQTDRETDRRQHTNTDRQRETDRLRALTDVPGGVH